MELQQKETRAMSRSRMMIAVLALVAAGLFAQSAVKRGYVNMETVFNEYYKTTNENVNFETQRRQMNATFAVMRNEYRASLEEYRKAKEEAENELLSNDKREAAKGRIQVLEGRLTQKQEEMQQFRERSLGQLQQRQQQVTEALLKELFDQLRKFADAKGYGEILEVSGRTMSRTPAVLVYPPEMDITAALVKQVNAGHEKEKQEASAKLEELRRKAEAELKAAEAELRKARQGAK